MSASSSYCCVRVSTPRGKTPPRSEYSSLWAYVRVRTTFAYALRLLRAYTHFGPYGSYANAERNYKSFLLLAHRVQTLVACVNASFITNNPLTHSELCVFASLPYTDVRPEGAILRKGVITLRPTCYTELSRLTPTEFIRQELRLRTRKRERLGSLTNPSSHKAVRHGRLGLETKLKCKAGYAGCAWQPSRRIQGT